MTNLQKDALAWSQAHRFCRDLRDCRGILTIQQLRTLRGQALSGDIDGARKGLDRALREAAR